MSPRDPVAQFYEAKRDVYGDAPRADNAHAKILARMGTGADVLEVGCGSGHLGGAIRALGNRVTGIEIAASAARDASSRLDHVLTGSLEDPAFVLPSPSSFDVVLCPDVLEHLFDPLAALRRLVPLLRANGRLIVSLPNVAHFTTRWALLNGRWDYQDIGILDRGHIRFFTQASAERLVGDAGLTIVERDLALSVPHASPVARKVIDLAKRLPHSWKQRLARLIAVQFVLVTVRTP